MENPELEVTQQLDCRQMLCPMPIFRVSQAMKKLQVGAVLKVLCTDPGSLRDFPAFARQSGHELLRTEEEDGAHVFYLRKGGAK